MLEHVAIQQSNGKTISSYAKQIGVTRHKMQYWVNKYKASHKTKKVESDSSLKFIDLGSFGVKDQSGDSSSLAKSSSTKEVLSLQDERLPQMTLTFPSGMCLKIY
ncbi:hypothetical protein BY457_1481 [Marinilabilia salmonicolor]|nr:hypothetical protein BY457_1481 [Marinilabilia salmonicolor]